MSRIVFHPLTRLNVDKSLRERKTGNVTVTGPTQVLLASSLFFAPRCLPAAEVSCFCFYLVAASSNEQLHFEDMKAPLLSSISRFSSHPFFPMLPLLVPFPPFLFSLCVYGSPHKAALLSSLPHSHPAPRIPALPLLYSRFNIASCPPSPPHLLLPWSPSLPRAKGRRFGPPRCMPQ